MHRLVQPAQGAFRLAPQLVVAEEVAVVGQVQHQGVPVQPRHRQLVQEVPQPAVGQGDQGAYRARTWSCSSGER